MKKIKQLFIMSFCLFALIPSSHASFHDSMVGRWFFHQTFTNPAKPQERWLLTQVEFFPNGQCTILNQPNSNNCEWTQDAIVAEFKTYSDSGLPLITWRGALDNTNLLLGTGFNGDQPVAKMFLMRDATKASTYPTLEVRSVLGFWGFQFKKGNGPWVSNTIYFSEHYQCSLDVPFESCSWSQDLGELRVVLKISKNEDPMNLYVSPLDTKEGFYGKIVDNFKKKKAIGEFYLNSK